MKFEVIGKTPLRQEPENDAEIVTEEDFFTGSFVYLLDKDEDELNSWYHVLSMDDKEGWVEKKYLKRVYLHWGSEEQENEIVKKTSSYIESKPFQKLIERLKTEDIKIDEKMNGREYEWISIYMGQFYNAVNKTNDLSKIELPESNGWEYTLNSLDNDFENFYRYIHYLIKNPIIYIKKETKWYIEQAALPQSYSQIIYFIIEFALMKYFPEKCEFFWRRHIDYRNVTKFTKLKNEHYKKIFELEE